MIFSARLLNRSSVDGAPSWRARIGLLASAAFVVGVAGCSFDLQSVSDEPSATTSGSGAAADCAATVREAAFAVEIDDQVELFDVALVACGSVDELTAEIDKYPRFTGYTTQYLIAQRCENVDTEEVRNSDVCVVAAPTTTLPPAATNDIVYTGETLDGRQVQLRASADLQFIDDSPAEIKNNVDIAIAEGCDGVIGRRDFWYNIYVSSGDEAASVFAQHAQNVANLLNCGLRPFPSGSGSSATAD